MRWFHDAEIDIASFYLVDHIAEGEIEQAVGFSATRPWPPRSSYSVGRGVSSSNWMATLARVPPSVLGSETPLT